MKKQLLLILLITSFLTPLAPTAAAAQHTNPTQTTTFLPIFDDSYIDPESVLADGGLVLEIGEGATFEQIVVESPSAFAISCPVGVTCDANYAYRAHQYRDERVSMYMSFSPEIVDSYSTASVVEQFNYLNLRIYFPAQDTEDSTVYFGSLSPLRVLGEEVDLLWTDGMSLELTAYEDRHLRGTIRGVMTEIITRTEDPTDSDCVTDDIIGICYEDESTYLPFTVHFNIPVQEN